MIPTEFPEANATLVHPEEMHEQQVKPARAFMGPIQGGSCAGITIIVTAWAPTADDLAQLNEGKPLFISFINGVPPHYPSTDFHAATHPQ